MIKLITKASYIYHLTSQPKIFLYPLRFLYPLYVCGYKSITDDIGVKMNSFKMENDLPCYMHTT